MTLTERIREVLKEDAKPIVDRQTKQARLSVPADTKLMARKIASVFGAYLVERAASDRKSYRTVSANALLEIGEEIAADVTNEASSERVVIDLDSDTK